MSIDPLIHDKLYELLHTLIDELAGYKGYEEDARDLRQRAVEGFENLDNAMLTGAETIDGRIVGGYIRTAFQVQELIKLARAETA